MILVLKSFHRAAEGGGKENPLENVPNFSNAILLPDDCIRRAFPRPPQHYDKLIHRRVRGGVWFIFFSVLARTIFFWKIKKKDHSRIRANENDQRYRWKVKSHWVESIIPTTLFLFFLLSLSLSFSQF